MRSTYRPVLVTPPTEAPVTAAEAKAQIPGGSAADDILVEALIDAATEQLDGWSGTLGRCLVSQTWRQTFDGFCDKLRLPLPALSVSAVSYLAPGGGTATVSDSVYVLRHDALGSYVDLAEGQAWPAPATRSESVSVTFVAGYGAAAAVPKPIKQAIILMASRLFQDTQRDATLVLDRSDGVGTYQWDNSGALAAVADKTVAALLSSYRRVGL